MTDQDDALYGSPFNHMVASAIRSVPVDPDASPEDVSIQHEAVALALGALDPQDAYDTLTAATAVIAQQSAIACFRRAAMSGVSDQMACRLLTIATSLARLSAQTVISMERRKAVARIRAARSQA